MKKKLFFCGMVLILVALVVIICVLFIPKDKNLDNNNLNVFTFTTNKGNVIEMRCQYFSGFSFKVPRDFEVMSDDLVALKYPNGIAPTLVFTNESGTINVTINQSDVILKNKDVVQFTSAMAKVVKQNLGDIDIEVNSFERDDHAIGSLKFISKAIDTDIYNYMILFSNHDKFTVMSFNCLIDDKKEWQDVGEFIFNSIVFKEQCGISE